MREAGGDTGLRELVRRKGGDGGRRENREEVKEKGKRK